MRHSLMSSVLTDLNNFIKNIQIFLTFNGDGGTDIS
jgi:hypothetical protein